MCPVSLIPHLAANRLPKTHPKALYDRTACLLGNHGMVCHGPTLKRAVNQAHRLEIMCRQYVLSRQLGEPKYLTDDDWYAFHNRGKD